MVAYWSQLMEESWTTAFFLQEASHVCLRSSSYGLLFGTLSVIPKIFTFAHCAFQCNSYPSGNNCIGHISVKWHGECDGVTRAPQAASPEMEILMDVMGHTATLSPSNTKLLRPFIIRVSVFVSIPVFVPAFVFVFECCFGVHRHSESLVRKICFFLHSPIFFICPHRHLPPQLLIITPPRWCVP